MALWQLMHLGTWCTVDEGTLFSWHITPILLLWDLNTLCVVDHLWPLIYIYIYICISAEGATIVSWHWLSRLRGWGSLTMTFLLLVYIYIYTYVYVYKYIYIYIYQPIYLSIYLSTYMYITYNGCSNNMAAPKKQPHRVPTFILISAILSKQHTGFDNYHKFAVRVHVRVPKFCRTWRTWANAKKHISGVILFT